MAHTHVGLVAARRGTPHLQRTSPSPPSRFLFVYGHSVHAVRDDAKECAHVSAPHRELHVRTVARRRYRLRPGRRIGDGGGHLDQGERVTTICAQRTSRGEVHVVPLGTPTRAADHFCERRRSFRRHLLCWRYARRASALVRSLRVRACACCG